MGLSCSSGSRACKCPGFKSSFDRNAGIETSNKTVQILQSLKPSIPIFPGIISSGLINSEAHTLTEQIEKLNTNRIINISYSEQKSSKISDLEIFVKKIFVRVFSSQHLILSTSTKKTLLT
jgi:hypothetical protein